jgi:PmbA protein
MVGEEKLKVILQQSLSKAPAPQAEIAVVNLRRSVVRFAHNEIQQNAQTQNYQVLVRTLWKKRLGSYGLNSLRLAELKTALHKSYKLAQTMGKPVGFLNFAAPSVYQTPLNQEDWFSSAQGASLVQQMIKFAQAVKVELNGCLWQQSLEAAVCNSAELWAYSTLSRTGLNVTAEKSGLRGYAQWGGKNLKTLNFEEVLREALWGCLSSGKFLKLKPADYPVVLDSYAMAELLSCLNLMAFNGQAWAEGSSFMAGRQGEKIFPATISIYDDAFDPRSPGLPFDFEGVPRQKVWFIKKGAIGTPVLDRYYAGKLKQASTGHALFSQTEAQSPAAQNLIMAGGSSQFTARAASIPQALLIKRFHYVRPLHNLSTTVTGMTRDGIYLLKDGELAGRCPDIRFTHSIIDLLKGIRWLSKETKTLLWLDEAGFESIIAPAAYIEGFGLI